MPDGTWVAGRVDSGTATASVIGSPAPDNFRFASSGTAAGTAGIVISAKPGRVYRAYVKNGAATAYVLMIFDKASAPVNGDTPIESKMLAVSSEVEIDLSNYNGRPCANGIGIAISSTSGTLTLAVANDIVFRRVVFTASN